MLNADIGFGNSICWIHVGDMNKLVLWLNTLNKGYVANIKMDLL